MKLDKGFSLFREVWGGALLLNGGQRPEEKRLDISERDCNELHINNAIILLSGEKKRKGRVGMQGATFSPLRGTVESPIQTDHRGYASRNMQPIHSEKIASKWQRQATKSVLIHPAAL